MLACAAAGFGGTSALTRPALLTGGGSLVPEADSRMALCRADQVATPELYAIRLELVPVAVNGGWQCGLGLRARNRLAATGLWPVELRRAVDLAPLLETRAG